jgi:hypothetical protein
MKLTRRDFLVGTVRSIVMLHVPQAEAKQLIQLLPRACFTQL